MSFKIYEPSLNYTYLKDIVDIRTDVITLNSRVATIEDTPVTPAGWTGSLTATAFASSTLTGITGNQTISFFAGTRLRIVGTTTGTVYATVVSSSFSATTSIVIEGATAAIANEELTISYSFLTNNASSFNAPYFPSTAEELSASPTMINYTYPIGNVKRYGAIGDGANDDTIPINDANAVANAVGCIVFFPNGDYFLTDQITIYNGAYWQGEEMPSEFEEHFAITRIQNAGTTMTLTITDPDNDINYRIMSGDTVIVSGAANSVNNGLFSADSVDPVLHQIVVTNDPCITETNPLSATVTLRSIKKGSVLRYRNLGDGSIITGSRFIDCTGLRNLKFHDLGFIGPGVNSSSGGGLRFRRTSNNRAISGYDFNNIFLSHVSGDGMRFDQLIFSTLRKLNIKKITGDGLLFKEDPNIGGTTTSVHIDTCYINNCRRGITMYTAAYCTFTNTVIEGCPIGYFVNRGLGVTFNSAASETIKFGGSDGKANGVTFYLSNTQGCVLNSPTIYYHPGEYEWGKASIQFIDTAKRVEHPCAVVSSGHFHQSVGPKIPIIGTAWTTTTGRVYLNVHDDDGYKSPSGSTQSTWIGASSWDTSVQVEFFDVVRHSSYNSRRFKANDIQKNPFDTGTATTLARAPTVNDDNLSGFAAWQTDGTSYFVDSTVGTREGRYFCTNASTGAAVWVNNEQIYYIDFLGRVSQTFADASETAGAYAMRLGRNYGADILTDYGQRVLETQTDGTGQLIAYLDITGYFPAQYIGTVNYNPFSGTSTREYSLVAPAIANVDGTDYILFALKVTSPGNYVFADTITASAGAGSDGTTIYLRFKDLGPDYQVTTSFYKENDETKELFLYVTKERFFTNGSTIDIRNARFSEMNRLWTVDSTAITTSSSLSESVVCIAATCSDIALTANIAQGVDDAIYVSNRFTYPVVSEINVLGTNHLYISDEANAISIQDGRSGNLSFADGAATDVISVSGANCYDFVGFLPTSAQTIHVSGSTYNTVTFTRSLTTGIVTGFWKGYKKKNPGLGALWDRN